MSTIVLSVPRHGGVAFAAGRVSPLDLGAVAEAFGINPGLAPDWYQFAVCGDQPGLQPTRGGLQLVVDHGPEELAAVDTIVVLPVSRFVRERPADQILQPLAAAAARGCLGAFVLAAAGLLDHWPATTHWRYCDVLSAAFPLIQVIPGVLYVDDGDILTSGGVAAGIDLCLHVVRMDYGAELTNMLARRMIETTRMTIAEIARHAGFEDVSVFRRHFTSQAGLSPNAYRRTFGQPNGEHDNPAPTQTSRGRP
jgi:AraC family transcriptional activator FtrA